MVVHPWSSLMQESADQRCTTMAPVDVRVHAIVVTYQPEQRALIDLLEALSPQVERIHVVDNSANDDLRVATLLDGLQFDNVVIHRLGGNHGIAKALNVGISHAQGAGATYVLLSDQDSLPATDMVAGLLVAHAQLVANGCKVGAVGPMFTDRNTGHVSSFQAEIPGKFFYGHVRPDTTRPEVEALTLITSGMLAAIEVFDDAGGMREDFFIDHVDIEWCHRVRTRGWRLYGTRRATMFHRMGDASLRVWYFGWRQESAYSPLRIYYRIRNFIALCKSPMIDWRWKLRNGWYWLGFVYSHVMFGGQKKRSLVMASRGLADGLRGRMGPFSVG
jgi:rhamnosyltransferase